MKKSTIAAIFLVFAFAACEPAKQKPEPPIQGGPPQVYAHIEFVDYETGLTVPELTVSMGAYDYMTGYFEKTDETKTDNAGICTFQQVRLASQLMAHGPNDFLLPPVEFPGIVEDLSTFTGYNPFSVKWTGTDKNNRFFRANVFKRAPTQIHLRQLNKVAPMATDTIIYISMEHFVTDKNYPGQNYGMGTTYFLPNGRLVLSYDRLLDTVINVDLIANMENKIKLSLLKEGMMSWDGPITMSTENKAAVLKTGSNSFLFEF